MGGRKIGHGDTEGWKGKSKRVRVKDVGSKVDWEDWEVGREDRRETQDGGLKPPQQVEFGLGGKTRRLRSFAPLRMTRYFYGETRRIDRVATAERLEV